MLEVNSFFNGIYIYKFASREGYISKLEEFEASQDVLNYADTLEEQYLGIVVGAVAKGKSLSEIQDLVNKKKRVDELKSKTKDSIESEIPSHLNSNIRSWAISQIKKFPGKKNLILSNLDRINNSIQEYRIDLISYDIDALLSYLNELEGKNSEISSDSQLNAFLQKASEFAFKEFRKINNPKLISWAKVRLIAIIREWKSNIEKATAQTPFQELIAEAYQLKEDIDAGKYRGKEIPHTPLRHHEYDSLVSNIEFLDDWEKATSPDLFNMGFKEVIDASHEWHKTAAESGIGLQYNPINRSDIVWENDEYFILELKDEKDLKVEGAKQIHCVGTYGEKIKQNECRIFSLRAKNAVYSPILTIETDMSGAIVRQDYGAGNSRIDKKYHDMVTEWSTGNVLDVKTLSNQDKYRLIFEKGDENILATLAGDAHASVRRAVAEKTTDENILATLAGDEDSYVRQTVAQKTTDENILAQLAGDEDSYVRRAVAQKTTNENILATLVGDKNYEVRQIVAQKTTDENILATLAGDEEPYVRRAVVQKTTNENILATLAGDAHTSVRWAVAEKTTNEKILAQLAGDKNYEVRQTVAEKTTDEKILATLAGDEEPYVRQTVAEKTTNEKILAQLANDKDKHIKGLAIQRLQELRANPKIANLSKAVNVFCKIIQASYN